MSTSLCRYEVKVKSPSQAGGAAKTEAGWGFCQRRCPEQACWQEARAQRCQLRRATLRPPDLVLLAIHHQGPGALGFMGLEFAMGGSLGCRQALLCGANKDYQGCIFGPLPREGT